jgi:hypothetical protein
MLRYEGNSIMIMIFAFLGFAIAQEPANVESTQENTLETVFVVQGEIQRPDLTILMSKDDVTDAYELQLVDSFLPKILESMKHSPL